MTVQVVSTKRETHHVKLAVYGQAGIGKTVLCSTAPSPIIISAEKGLLSLADKDIPVIEVNTLGEFREAYTFLKEHGHAYETICLDSISDVAEQVFDAKMAEITRKAEEDGKNVDGRQAYGKMAIEMAQLTRAFRALPHHIVFTAKQGTIKDEAANALRFGPMLPGQVYTLNFPYFMDIVLAMRMTKDKVRYLQTQPDFQYLAKDRSGKLDDMEKPDLTMLFNKVLSGGKTQT
jgi:hypothetical protein